MAGEVYKMFEFGTLGPRMDLVDDFNANLFHAQSLQTRNHVNCPHVCTSNHKHITIIHHYFKCFKALETF